MREEEKPRDDERFEQTWPIGDDTWRLHKAEEREEESRKAPAGERD